MNIGLILIYLVAIAEIIIAIKLHKKPKNQNHNYIITTLNWLMMLLLVWWATGWRFI